MSWKPLAAVMILAFIIPRSDSKSVDPPSSPQRSINGILTTVKEHYTISLQYDFGKGETHICGGSLISPKCFLTAEHCVSNESRTTQGYSINTGSSYYNFGGQSSGVSDIFIPDDNDMDVAILLLRDPIFEDENVKFVEIDFTRKPEEGDLVTLAGWGSTYTPEDFLGHLKPMRMIEQNVMSQRECETANDNTFCVNGSGPEVGCFGDSGSPIMHRRKQVGIASYITGSCLNANLGSTRLSSAKVSQYVKQKIMELHCYH